MTTKRRVSQLFLAALLLAPAVAFAEDDPRALLAQAQMMDGRYPEAIKNYQEALVHDPQNTKLRIELADVLSWEKRYAEAISHYQKVLEKTPDSEKVRIKLGRTYLWNGQSKEALEVTQMILNKNSRQSDALAIAGEALMLLERYEEALEAMDKRLLEGDDRHVRWLRAETLFFLGRSEDAKDKLVVIAKESPENLDAKTRLAEIEVNAGRYVQARAICAEILTRDSTHRGARELIALTSAYQRDYKGALALYDELLKEKEDEKVRLQRARVLGWYKRHEDSWIEYKKTFALHSNANIEMEMQAKRLNWDRRIEAAIARYETLIQRDPANLEARFDLGELYATQSMTEKATQTYQSILKVAPDHILAHDSLKKVRRESTRPSWTSSFASRGAESQDRKSDINKDTWKQSLRFPLTHDWELGVSEALTQRKFSDFPRLTENEMGIGISYRNKPAYWVDAFYQAVTYNRNIDTVHLFGGAFHKRVWDRGVVSFSHGRRRIEETSSAIRERILGDDYTGRIEWDWTARWKSALDYTFSKYTDGNQRQLTSTQTSYTREIEAVVLKAIGRVSYLNFKDERGGYFSPGSFRMESLSLGLRHYLNQHERFYGARDIYYEFYADISIDDQDVVGQRIDGRFYWDVTDSFYFLLSGWILRASDDVYKEHGIDLLARYVF